MKTRSVVAIVLLCGFFFVCRAGRAAGNDAEEKVTALNRSAVEAYGQGDFKKMKVKLQEALKIAKKDLDGQPMLARTYLHMGVLYVDGLDNREAGVKAFAAALKLNPAIQITAGMDTKTVNDAFAEARSESAGGAAPVAKEVGQKPAPETPIEKPSAKAAERAAPAPTAAAKANDAQDEVPEVPARKLSPKEERAAKKEEARNGKLLEAEKKRNAAAEEKLTKQLAQAQKDLAEARQTAATERSEKERLQRELKQSAEDAKKQVADAQAETKRLAKQVSDDAKKQALEADAQAKKQAQELDKERAAKDKQLADGQARENKEREAKEKLQQQLQERDKLLAETKQALADAKQVIQQAEKDKAAKDKAITEGQARENKEREAKEKLEKEKQAAKEKEAERKAKDDADRAERAKLAAGPPVPDHFSEAVYCDLPEIANPGTDLYVHCVAQAKVKAKEMTFFYRASGASLYNALVMEKSKKGWFMTMVPGDRITGRSLQYYAEAHGDQRAANGKPGSPNVMALRAK